MMSMISMIYKETLNIFKKLPVKAWGLTLLGGVLELVAIFAGILPIIWIPLMAVISAGLSAVYLAAYRGEEASSHTLLGGFKDFKRVSGGMCWGYLWIFLWYLIPIAGLVIGTIKSISYSFIPYILNEEKDISATDAIKESMRRTKGHKGKIFLALIILPAAYIVAFAILSFFAKIPFIGVIFSLAASIISIAYSLFSSLFIGIVTAGFYEYLKVPAPAATAEPEQNPEQQDTPKNVCPACGCMNDASNVFCIKCGTKIQ